MKRAIETKLAPTPVGPYSQAIRTDQAVYLSGQIALDPATGKIVDGDAASHARRALDNLRHVAEAAGGSLDQIVKLNLYLTDMTDFSAVNNVMTEYFTRPWPARTTIEVAALPRGSQVEIDAVLAI